MTLVQEDTQGTSVPIDPTLFRQTMGQFPTGVTIVSAKLPDARCLGVTINSLTSVSLDPPLILFCMKKAALAHDIIVKASSFVISILACDQEELARLCAKGGGMELESKLIDCSQGSGMLVKGAVASIECDQEAVHPGGDHHIILGRVKALYFDPYRQPLVFHRSRFTKVTVS